mmetsp:Transcript_10915/g.10955  ORF Transcript_10915/g.10955 Transcript_10915/m.10955 type:complete len:88 (+) Transcript_10915:373-636(+)
MKAMTSPYQVEPSLAEFPKITTVSPTNPTTTPTISKGATFLQSRKYATTTTSGAEQENRSEWAIDVKSKLQHHRLKVSPRQRPEINK